MLQTAELRPGPPSETPPGPGVATPELMMPGPSSPPNVFESASSQGTRDPGMHATKAS